MWSRPPLATHLLILVGAVANLAVVVVGLTLATGPVRTAVWVVAGFQCLILLGLAAAAGWRITRRYAAPRQPDSAEADYHDPPRAG